MTDREQYKKRIIQLAQKWEEGTLTPEEKEEFEQWYNSFNDKKMPDSDQRHACGVEGKVVYLHTEARSAAPACGRQGRIDPDPLCDGCRGTVAGGLPDLAEPATISTVCTVR